MNLKYFRKIAKYLGINSETISTSNGKVSVGDQQYAGLAAALLALGGNYAPEQEAALYQWLEFACLYSQQLKGNPSQTKLILKELNSYLVKCSYLVGFSMSLADVAVYHVVHCALQELSCAEREGVLALCRWCQHVQQDALVRQDNALINFSSTYVSSRLTCGY